MVARGKCPRTDFHILGMALLWVFHRGVPVHRRNLFIDPRGIFTESMSAEGME